MNKRAFSGLTLKSAEHLHWAFKAAKALKLGHIVLQGTWHRRRFVIETGHAFPAPVPEMSSNTMALTLALPVDIDAEELMRRCRSFGGEVERRWRDHHASFDSVVSADDGQRHQVHAYHHVALCGHKAATWLNDDEVPRSGLEGPTCAKCVSVAKERPRHAARWHPLAGEAGTTEP